MKTDYIVVNPLYPEEALMEKAARLLRAGEVVAFPTETVYGLGANALNVSAVEKIFSAKGRPSDNPLIVHVGNEEQLLPLVKEIPAQARILMEKFWPGPLTLIFSKSPSVPGVVTGGLDTVAVRMPAHPVALRLIRQSGVPVAAPSANISGRPSPTTAKHVWDDLKGKIPLVLDGGETKVGLESTVLDLTGDSPAILRPGGVTREDLEEMIGPVRSDPGRGDVQAPRAPGMKYIHYAPKADLFIVAGHVPCLGDKFIALSEGLHREGKKVALLLSEETAREMAGKLAPPPHYMEILGSRRELAAVAHKLFAALRNCDLAGTDVILIEEFPQEGVGAAVMNRVKKAAGYKVIN